MRLDEMYTQAEMLLALLADPQPGLMSWNMLLADRLQTIADMAATAGIKAKTGG